jgi:NAD(P)-dependent dehydrogenase (short-subunit alcohol dehydrogenase family)
MSNFMLENRVAIVTGAASVRGIGRATALTLAKAGADVAVCDVNVAGQDFDLEGTAAEIRRVGRRSLAVKVDITHENEVNTFVRNVAREFGRLDIMVNNAAVEAVTPDVDVPQELWDKVMSVNTRGCHNGCIAASKIMKEQRQGSIININSICGLKWAPLYYAYGISKAGIRQITTFLGKELSKYNVRVNGIAPGGIDTDMNNHDIGGSGIKLDHSCKGIDKKTLPMGRVGQTSDIAGVVLFLASDLSGYVTGQTIVVDGGGSL